MDRHKNNKMSLLSFFGGRRKKTAASVLFTCNSVVLIFSSGRGNDSTLAKKSSAAPPHPTWNQSLASSVMNPLLWSHKCPEAEIEEKTPKHTRAHTNTHKTHIFFTAILNARKATECYKRRGRGGFCSDQYTFLRPSRRSFAWTCRLRSFFFWDSSECLCRRLLCHRRRLPHSDSCNKKVLSWSGEKKLAFLQMRPPDMDWGNERRAIIATTTTTRNRACSSSSSSSPGIKSCSLREH